MSETNKNESSEKERLYRYGSKQIVLYPPSLILAFLNHVIRLRGLPIGSVINGLKDRQSFFLIAATGLGKTLTIPLWLLFRHMCSKGMRPPLATGEKQIAAESPRVWVVEPTVAVCQEMEAELNDMWSDWRIATGAAKPSVPLFGCKTRTDKTHEDAPIMFITTGIFAIYARKGMFKSGRDIVLMDEAHKTLESDESVELGVALCRCFKVDINYMSATVDPAGLEAALGVRVKKAVGVRHHTWRHNTKKPLEECIVDLIRKTLVEQDRSSEYFPPENVLHAEEIVRAVFEQDRAKGLLIMVNSYASANSEAARVEKLLRNAFPGQPFEIGLLSGETRRIRAKRIAYKQMIERWKEQKKRYVLIATSVVEMGVTLPSLDYVVTSDDDFEGEPLRINSLIQRMGRVGRERPGIAYVVREAEAPYSDLDDAALNAPGALAPEQIRFPMKNGHLTGLAHLTLQWHWAELSEVEQLTGTLPVPSFDEESSAELFVRYQKEYARLIDLGVGTQSPPGLTREGALMDRWIGRADLGAAMAAQKAFQAGDVGSVFRSLAKCAWSSISERERRYIPEHSEEKAETRFSRLKTSCAMILNDSRKKLDSGYHEQESLEHIAEVLMQDDCRMNSLIGFVNAFLEMTEIFQKVNAAGSGREVVMHNASHWNQVLRRFVASFAG